MLHIVYVWDGICILQQCHKVLFLIGSDVLAVCGMQMVVCYIQMYQGWYMCVNYNNDIPESVPFLGWS